MGIACSKASARTTRSVVSRTQQTEAFSHLLKLPNKDAENNLGLSLVDIGVIPTKPFSPHANPIPGTNNHPGDAWSKRPGCSWRGMCPAVPVGKFLWLGRSQSAVYQIFKKFADSSSFVVLVDKIASIRRRV